ncbi:MAG: DUF6079 family protein [Acidobacteriota bacterium]
MAERRIGDLIDVRRRPIVVRLDDLNTPGAGWISEAFFLTAELQGHLAALRHALAQPTGCGMFLIGHYGAGKSHFLAYLTQQLAAGAWLPDAPHVVPLSLLNFRAEVPLEDVILQALGAVPSNADRRELWEAIEGRFPRGLFLLLDELSEFLRSKPTRQAFNEDVRFLQFLGERAGGCRLFVLAAMQEQIEHLGALDSALYRKIKDRYRVRFLLTPAHVRDLVSHHLLEKKPGYADAVAELAREAAQALPGATVDWQAFQEVYPLHPATLELLEEVRDIFSQARGIVDFIVTRLAGDPARGAAPFLERPWGEVLAPDAIVDHFGDLLELQPELVPIAQKVLAYYRGAMAQLFATEAQTALAWRLLKLLVLVHLSPRRQGLTAAEAASWLLLRTTSAAPAKNVQIAARLLATLAAEGRYVREEGGQYRLDLADEGSEQLDRLLRREVKELGELADEAAWEALVPLLEDEAFNPLALPRDRWQERTLRWRLHERSWSVYLGSGFPPQKEGPALCIRLPWGDSGAAPGLATLQPSPVLLTPALLELAALGRVCGGALAPELRKLIDRRIQERRPALATAVRAAFLEAQLSAPSGEQATHPLVKTATTSEWLDGLAEWLLRRLYPSFEKFAPAGGPLPKEAYRQLARAARKGDPGEYEVEAFVKLAREAYLVPMGLLRRQGMAYVPPPRIESHELVRLLMPLVAQQVAPPVVYEHLAASEYGLVPDQIHVLLVFLVLRGDIDLLKDRRSYRELFETMPLPIQYDRVVAGRGLPAGQIKALEDLCRGLDIRQPKQWTAGTQRETVARLRTLATEERNRLHRLQLAVEQTGGLARLAERARSLAGDWAALDHGEDELAGLQHFLYTIGDPAAFLPRAAELRGAAEKIQQAAAEAKRLRYLLAHPALATWDDPAFLTRRAELDSASPDSLAALEEWLQDAAQAYGAYTADYHRRHLQWWQAVGEDPIWAWQPPPLASSRHVGLADSVAAFDEVHRRAAAQRCRASSMELTFQPRCSCGFDGQRAPLEAELIRLGELKGQIEAGVSAFFAQEAVRSQMRRWPTQGAELNDTTIAYLDGRAAAPQVADVALLDRHLAGMELVKEVDGGALLASLAGRAWKRGELLAALSRELERHGSARLRLRAPVPARPGEDVLGWCAEQSLRHRLILPASLTPHLAAVAGALKPEWVSPATLAHLDELRLGKAIEDRILGWLLEGLLPPPAGTPASPLVAAAGELLAPSSPRSAAELAKVVRNLYVAHERLWPLAGERWLERLAAAAEAPVLDALPPIAAALAERESAQWLVVDCLGLPLLGALEEAVAQALDGWKPAALTFAQVGRETTTGGWLTALAASGVNHPLEKVNAVDRLIHERSLPFSDLVRVAAAELAAALRVVRRRLDPTRPLLVFADHGFRISPDGRHLVHGGPSTLERTVPLLELAPR